MESVYEQMFSSEVRLEESWPFPVSPASESLREAIEDRIDGLRLPDAIKALLEGWSDDDIDALAGHGWESSDAFDELCGTAFRKGISGWLGIAATPVFTPSGDSGSSSFSWGHYRTELLFAESGEALLAASVEWAEACHNRDNPARLKATAAGEGVDRG